ncbi:MAG: WD40/YVTN/BNR-like repeat-containing protein, partial [Vulcanimicrobiaceae bacterium]
MLVRLSLRLTLVLAALLCVTSTAFAAAVNPASALHWRFIGPLRAGRTVAISGVPTQPNVFYIGAVNGGVWRTDDAGRTWDPLFDAQPTQSIGAIAVAPSDPSIIYVGSGEGLRRPDLAIGDGMWKSTDAGKHWLHIGLDDAQQIGGIAVDPHNPNRVFAAVMGHPYGPNATRGLYRSTDGGATWKHVLGPTDSNVGAVGVVIDPNDTNTVYADIWGSRNGPWHFFDIYQTWSADGLYKSTDGAIL